MDLKNFILGFVLCVYAVIVTVLRIKGNQKYFRKLEPMKKFWGNRLGLIIHTVGYIVIPAIAGVIFLVASFQD